MDKLQHTRSIARSLGVLADFNRLIEAIESGNLEKVDRVFDTLVPTLEGAHTTFLPSFAMAATESFMRNRVSWKALRDRVFANMEEMGRLAQTLTDIDTRERLTAMVNSWRLENELYSAENDPKQVQN